MKKLIFLIFIFLFTSLNASEYAVVVNVKTKAEKVSKKQIKNIFLKKRSYIGEQKIIPVNLSSNMPLRLDFEKNILSMSRDELNIFWTKQHFHGVSPPSIQTSYNSVKLFIKNVDGAIGYLPIEFIDETLKVLYEF